MEHREHIEHHPLTSARDGPPQLAWEWQPFAALAPHALHAALLLRAQVFVLEQECPFVDPDAYDAHAFHLLGWTHAARPVLAAYLRVLVPGSKYAEPSIGRVITTASLRRQGLGRVLMEEGIRRTHDAFPGRAIRISAQERLRAFYDSLGFTVASERYLEDNIRHIDMLLAT